MHMHTCVCMCMYTSILRLLVCLIKVLNFLLCNEYVHDVHIVTEALLSNGHKNDVIWSDY